MLVDACPARAPQPITKEQERDMSADHDGWLDVGVDLASKRWTNWHILTTDELAALGVEQWTNPVPGHNGEIRRLEADHPELVRKP